MMRLIYLEPALTDIESILDYISNDSPVAAVRFGEGLLETCRMLETNPELGTARDDLAKRLRLFTYRGYGLYYRIDHDRQVVLLGRVLHPALDAESQSFE